MTSETLTKVANTGESDRTLDPHGDCTLQLADQSTVLVSAKVLMLASPVFARLLTSGFKEGIDYAADQKAVLSLVHDDVEALIIICSILHHQDGDTSLLRFAGQLYRVAVLADKYDLIPPLRPHVALYCQNLLPQTVDEDLYQLLFVAYVFDLPRIFAQVSWHVLLRKDGRFTELPPALDHALIHHNTLGKLAVDLPCVRRMITVRKRPDPRNAC